MALDMKKETIATYPYCHSFETLNSPQSLSILSWNIIHKDFVDPDEGYGAYATEQDLNWNQRLPKIKKKLASIHADIICLQEVDKHSFDADIGKEFHQKHGYISIVNIPKKHKVDFTVAIMFKSSKYECVYKDQRARALIVLLSTKSKASKQKNICLRDSFFVVCVHLDSSKGGKDNEITRTNQIKSALKRINFCLLDKLKLCVDCQRKNVRCVIVGDFNTFYECNTAQMLINDNHTSFRHCFSFKEAYQQKIVRSNFDYHKLPPNDPHVRIKYFPTYCAVGIISAIDLMFYTANNMKLKAVTHTMSEYTKKSVKWNEILTKRIDEWTKSENRAYKLFWPNSDGEKVYNNNNIKNDLLLLPNQEHPSDHLPIAAEFEFTPLSDFNQCTCKRKQNKQNKPKKKINNKMNGISPWKYHEIISF